MYIFALVKSVYNVSLKLLKNGEFLGGNALTSSTERLRMRFVGR